MDLNELFARKEELLAVSIEPHDCEPHLQVRARVVAGGHRHYVQQCQVCGGQKGGPLAKASAAQLLRGNEAPAFDDAIGKARLEGVQNWYAELKDVNDKIQEILDPDAARLEAEADRKVETAKSTARAALDTAVQELKVLGWQRRHPFIIEHLKRHVTAFADPQAQPFERFTSEIELRAWLDTWIEEDFDVWREVHGRHPVSGTTVKLDYVLQPKSHLVARDFKPGPIGLEVKYLSPDGGFSRKASRFIWQAAAVSYTDCEFQLRNEMVRLPRVLLFSNLSFDDEVRLLRGIEPYALSNDRAKWSALLELANHANVGNLEMYGTRVRRAGWRIAFAAGVYFRRSGTSYSLSNPRLFEKERIGSFG
ncbi:MAG: hypothetical protein ABI476_05125 [Oxalobacteraceae bacterium]